MNKFKKLVNELKAKNYNSDKIKSLILEKSKTEIQHFNFWFKSFKVKSEEGAEKWKVIEIEGYASTKDEDRYGDVVNPSAFEDTIKDFMLNPVMLLQHDHNKRIWDFTKLEIDENGLYVKGDVKYTAGDDELFEKIEGKSLKGFSIWFRVLEAEWVDKTDEKGNVVDWLFVINKLDLIEISVVNVPANPYTLMKSIEDMAIKSLEGIEDEETDEDETDLEGENSNENQDENKNDEEEKKIDEVEEKTNKEEKKKEVEITDEKLDDPEAENNPEIDEKEKEDTEEGDEKSLDTEDEKDNIKELKKNLENPNEKKDNKKVEVITTKAIEKIINARLEGNEKAFKKLVSDEVKNVWKEFKKELDAIVELVKEIKETEQDLVDRIKSTVKGKGFINLKSTAEKQKESTRLNYILGNIKSKKY